MWLRMVIAKLTAWIGSAARRAVARHSQLVTGYLAIAALLTVIVLIPRLTDALYLNLTSKAVTRGYLRQERPDFTQNSPTRHLPASQALALASVTLDRIPHRPAAWRQMGRAWRLRDQAGRAKAAFRQALAVDPDDLIAREALANLHLAAGEHAMAMAEWRRLPAPVQLVALGDALFEAGRWQEGLAAYRSVIIAAPDFMAAYYHLGEAQYRYLEDYSGALATFRAARKQDPRSPWPYISIGDVFAAKDRLQQAIPWYRRALDIAPKEPGIDIKLAWAYTTYGDGLLREERWAEAEREYRAALEIVPAYVPAYRSLATLAWKGRGDPAAGVSFLQQAIAIDPYDIRTYAVLENLIAVAYPNSR